MGGAASGVNLRRPVSVEMGSHCAPQRSARLYGACPLERKWSSHPSLRDKIATKWLDAYNNGGPYPVKKLDEFLNLYKKVKDKDNFHVADAGPFSPGATHDKSFTLLNSCRNDFIHFTPKGWSLELRGLPRVCLDTLDLIAFFGWQSTAVLWHKKSFVPRAERAVENMRGTLRRLETTYGS
ncbi:MAG: hypothetical protein EPO47_12070 [Rugosibacter sp.]|nr:MAG: hypothetical protein EPO47_12070 [Rugosibacter sp.]